LEVPALKLFSPPPDQDDPTLPQTGISAWQFPEWFITQDVAPGGTDSAVRSRRLVHRIALSGGKFRDEDKKKWHVVPVRFVRACRAGHIGDIEWRVFVHGGAYDCPRQLWMDERGTSGDLSEVFVRCECGVGRSMIEAKAFVTSLGMCNGARPWLGQYAHEPCD